MSGGDGMGKNGLQSPVSQQVEPLVFNVLAEEPQNLQFYWKI
jgi:hypothetical protein